MVSPSFSAESPNFEVNLDQKKKHKLVKTGVRNQDAILWIPTLAGWYYPLVFNE